MLRIFVYALIVCWSLTINTTAQTAEFGKYKPQEVTEPFFPQSDAFGETIVPLIILPGFIDNQVDFDFTKLTYPAYINVLNEDNIDLVVKNFDGIKIDFGLGPVLVQDNLDAPAVQPLSSIESTDTQVFSTDISEGKEYQEVRNDLNFVIINDNSQVVSVTINDQDIAVTPSNIVEVSYPARFSAGDNEVEVYGVLEDGRFFRRKYEVFYKATTTQDTKDLFFVFNFLLGQDSNANNAFSKSLEKGRLANIYGLYEKVSAQFIQFGANAIYQVSPVSGYYLLFIGRQFLKNEQFGRRNFNLLQVGYFNQFDAIGLNASSYVFITNDNQDQYTVADVDVNYDFFYDPQPHTSLIVGANYILRRAPDDLTGDLTALYGSLNLLYPFDWLKALRFDLNVGSENYGSLDTKNNYYTLRSAMQLFKTSWILEALLSYTYRKYTNRLSLIVNDSTTLQSDDIFSLDLLYTYHISNVWDIFSGLSHTLVYSNRLPSDKTVISIGSSYLF